MTTYHDGMAHLFQQINNLNEEQQQRRLLLEQPEEDELSLESTDVLHKLMSLAFEIKDKIKENDYIQLVDGLKYIHDNPITRTRLQTTFVNIVIAISPFIWTVFATLGAHARRGCAHCDRTHTENILQSCP